MSTDHETLVYFTSLTLDFVLLSTSKALRLMGLDAKEADVRLYVPRPHAFEEGQELGTMRVEGWDELTRPLFGVTVVSVTSDDSNPKGADYVRLRGIPAPLKRVDWKPEPVGVVEVDPSNDSMVDKVAEALYDVTPTCSLFLWETLSHEDQEHWRTAARAAIGAVREALNPTPKEV